MILVACPSCKHPQKYNPMSDISLSKKKKKCVFCDKTFSVIKNKTTKKDSLEVPEFRALKT